MPFDVVCLIRRGLWPQGVKITHKAFRTPYPFPRGVTPIPYLVPPRRVVCPSSPTGAILSPINMSQCVEVPRTPFEQFTVSVSELSLAPGAFPEGPDELPGTTWGGTPCPPLVSSLLLSRRLVVGVRLVQCRLVYMFICVALPSFVFVSLLLPSPLLSSRLLSSFLFSLSYPLLPSPLLSFSSVLLLFYRL